MSRRVPLQVDFGQSRNEAAILLEKCDRATSVTENEGSQIPGCRAVRAQRGCARGNTAPALTKSGMCSRGTVNKMRFQFIKTIMAFRADF
jgi:hypothetical protein